MQDINGSAEHNQDSESVSGFSANDAGIDRSIYNDDEDDDIEEFLGNPRKPEPHVLMSDGSDPRIPAGFVLAPNGDDIVPNGTILDDYVYTLPNKGGVLLIASPISAKQKHGLGSMSKGIPPRIEAAVPEGSWASKANGFVYTKEFAAADDELSAADLSNKYTSAELADRRKAMIELRNTQRPLTPPEQALLDKIDLAHATRHEIEAKRDKRTSVMNGYARSFKTETLPEDWVWMASNGQAAAAYFCLKSPYKAYKAAVMDTRIPMQLWEDQLDSNSRPVHGRNGALQKIRPSESHLSREDYEIQKLTLDPTKGRIYTDPMGERCLNAWRDVQFPARPEEKYFKVAEIVKSWLEFIYPGRSEWILDYWAHAYQKLTDKPSVAMVWGGGQGIGKDTLLTIANYTFLAQAKAQIILTSQLQSQFNEFLFSPIVIVNELETKRSEPGFNKLKRDYKSYVGGLPSMLPVNPKGLPLQHVANIHRFYTTMNNEEEFPRDHDDRRFMILRSHVDRFQVAEKREEWFADCPMESGERFDILKWLAQGYGDAFTCWLMDRDISEFDPYNLPAALMKDYDELKKGIEIEPVIGAALNEVALTFGKWVYCQKEIAAGREPKFIEYDEDGNIVNEDAWPDDEADINSNKHWPSFVTAQQILHCRAAFDPDLDGEKIQKTKQLRGHLDVLMRTAGYIPVSRLDGKTQWVGGKKREGDATGFIRVQTSTIYIRRTAINSGETVEQRQGRAMKYIGKLTDFMRTPDGADSYWSTERWNAAF